MAGESSILSEKKCCSCNKIIFKGKIIIGIVEIKCKCGVKNTIVGIENSPEGRNFQKELQLVAQ